MTPDRAHATAVASRPLRVLHLLRWLTPAGGGIQAYVRALLQAFAGAGDVQFLGAAVGPGVPPAGFAAPPHLGAAGSSGRNVRSFVRHVRAAAPGADLVQIHGIYGPQFLLGAPCCRALGVPYLVNPHNALAPWMLAQKAWKKRLFYATVGGVLLRGAACVVATSEPEAEFIARRFPGVRVRLVRAGLAVPEQPQVTFLQEPPAGALRLLYLGSFDRWKRVPLLVQAVAELRAAGIDASATLCGSGPAALEQPVRDAITRWGVGASVRMAGYVTGSAKLQLIRASHLLVLPSLTDSYSMATAEALAQGLPVVVTAGAGAAPDVRRHDCGSVIPVEEGATALVKALREYADGALLQRRARNAHRYAREALDLPVLRAGMTALYRELTRA